MRYIRASYALHSISKTHCSIASIIQAHSILTMKLQNALLLPFVVVVFANPLNLGYNAPPGNATFISCKESTGDPICALVKQPHQDVLTTISHPNGTIETVRNKYTREHLQQIRIDNNISTVEYRPGETVPMLDMREERPRICTHEHQEWFDQHDWGYWYQAWNQIGNCFYCDDCDEEISASFSVSQTWTVGLEAKFNAVIKAQFSFSWGSEQSLSDSRKCRWKHVQHGCHSIWYQPLMSAHNGWANYQTHTHCPAGNGQGASDSFSDHNYAWANVNQAALTDAGHPGNMGCDSGCQGSDRRQCLHGNQGGLLWPHAN